MADNAKTTGTTQDLSWTASGDDLGDFKFAVLYNDGRGGSLVPINEVIDLGPGPDNEKTEPDSPRQ